jgi:hypothetical protein
MTSVAKTAKTTKVVPMADIVAKATATSKQPKAVVKEFGEAKVITVSDELASKMLWAGKRYKSIVATRAKQLVELKDIGAVLLEYRNACPSDKEFGKQIKTTSLKVISQQDRNDLMWLASNWKKLEELRSNGTLQSNSVGVLRKQFRELSKNSEADKTPKGVTAKSTSSKAKSAPTTTVAEQRDGMASKDASNKQSPKVTADALAKMVVDQLTKNGISVADFENAFESALKGTK